VEEYGERYEGQRIKNKPLEAQLTPLAPLTDRRRQQPHAAIHHQRRSDRSCRYRRIYGHGRWRRTGQVDFSAPIREGDGVRGFAFVSGWEGVLSEEGKRGLITMNRGTALLWLSHYLGATTQVWRCAVRAGLTW
jgi:hypothetical protein